MRWGLLNWVLLNRGLLHRVRDVRAGRLHGERLGGRGLKLVGQFRRPLRGSLPVVGEHLRAGRKRLHDIDFAFGVDAGAVRHDVELERTFPAGRPVLFQPDEFAVVDDRRFRHRRDEPLERVQSNANERLLNRVAGVANDELRRERLSRSSRRRPLRADVERDAALNVLTRGRHFRRENAAELRECSAGFVNLRPVDVRRDRRFGHPIEGTASDAGHPAGEVRRRRGERDAALTEDRAIRQGRHLLSRQHTLEQFDRELLLHRSDGDRILRRGHVRLRRERFRRDVLLRHERGRRIRLERTD